MVNLEDYHKFSCRNRSDDQEHFQRFSCLPTINLRFLQMILCPPFPYINKLPAEKIRLASVSLYPLNSEELCLHLFLHSDTSRYSTASYRPNMAFYGSFIYSNFIMVYFSLPRFDYKSYTN